MKKVESEQSPNACASLPGSWSLAPAIVSGEALAAEIHSHEHGGPIDGVGGEDVFPDEVK